MVGKVLGFAAQVAPWAVVSGLAYAAAFVKPSVEPLPLPQPLTESRDTFYDVSATGSDHFWFAGNNGVVLEGGTDPSSWARHSMPHNINLQGIATSDDGLVLAVGNEGWTFRREGEGQWESTQLPVSDIAGKLIEVAWLGDGFFAIGEMGAVFRSNAEAQDWTNLSIDGDVGLNDITRDGAGVLWITAEFGTVYQSDDNGKSWSGEELGYESLRSVEFVDGTGVIVGNGGVIFRSTDGGNSWTSVPSPTSEHLYDVIHDGSRWLAGGNGGVLLESANGDEWNLLTPESGTTGYVARLLPASDGVVVAGKEIGQLDGEHWNTWPATRGEEK
ncbi:WD40/YVTN/BNR-like repeat-containing protein [Marinobacter sp. F4216]|uniref:WD40/YVTN/BNR-like repeat-containing protein n=1 Tax=Marinobacter sp. F4216 TaxID=2874281 RepID=UPI001CBD0E40|nr:YCF48-related protein [Marinobacter sp. F4216]MBZ2168612.1 glycosyl hydrolase [Marinobacter sp. F4216]